jgi:serine/threonine protein kinase
MEAQLNLERGSARSSSFLVLPQRTYYVGSDPGADFVLAQLAPRHAALKLEEDGTLRVVDLAGGVRIDEAPLALNTPTGLRGGDLLILGPFALRVTLLGARRPSAARTARLGDPRVPSDRYELLGQIGSGAAGKVYSAIRRADGVQVAIKVLRQDVNDATIRKRFEREGLTAQKIESPYVLRVFEAEVSPAGHAFIVMEFVQGPSARDHISRGSVPVAEALRIAEDMAKGLAAAAEVGIVHRDVKPANVLLCPEGVAKLADFGMAKDLESTLTMLTVTGEGLGSLAYIPPEQLDEAKYADPRSDVYSLGASLYHLLAGVPPFNPTDPQSLFELAEAPPPPLLSLRPDVPPPIVALVDLMLEKDPDDRPPPWDVVGRLTQLREQLYPGYDFSRLFPQP